MEIKFEIQEMKKIVNKLQIINIREIDKIKGDVINMTTQQIFKQIYEDLKKQILENPKTTFLKEYIIPSKNYNSNSKEIEKLYFTSAIEMELYKIIEQFGNNICFVSYKDKYFFSNDKEIATARMLFEVEQEAKKKNNYKCVETR